MFWLGGGKIDYEFKFRRRERSKYLLSAMVDVVKDDEIISAKETYVRNRNKRQEYLCLISTDINLDENENIRYLWKTLGYRGVLQCMQELPQSEQRM